MCPKLHRDESALEERKAYEQKILLAALLMQHLVYRLLLQSGTGGKQEGEEGLMMGRYVY